MNRNSIQSRAARRLGAFATTAFITAAVVAGCASTGVPTSSSQMSSLQTSPLQMSALRTTSLATGPLTSPAQRTAALPPIGWRVTTLEHVDLWLHGFAMLTSDTGLVPFFARGYKQRVTALKRQRNLFTQLDANQPDLSARFGTNPSLANAQFAAMYFSSFQEIVNATDLFIRSNGNPRAARDPQMQQEMFLLAQDFPTPADRNWLRIFVQSLQDERDRFFHEYWTSEQQTRGAAYTAFQQAWVTKYYPVLSRFLNNSQQGDGQLVLSITMGGEGRTINDNKANMIVVDYPTTAEAAPEALFGFVHEAVARLVDESIQDNVTPAEVRSGASSGYTGNGAVRGGALVLQHVAPELVAGYMRYYLKTMNVTPPAGDPSSLFASNFPLPPAILSAIDRDITSVLGGI